MELCAPPPAMLDSGHFSQRPLPYSLIHIREHYSRGRESNRGLGRDHIPGCEVITKTATCQGGATLTNKVSKYSSCKFPDCLFTPFHRPFPPIHSFPSCRSPQQKIWFQKLGDAALLSSFTHPHSHESIMHIKYTFTCKTANLTFFTCYRT